MLQPLLLSDRIRVIRLTESITPVPTLFRESSLSTYITKAVRNWLATRIPMALGLYDLARTEISRCSFSSIAVDRGAKRLRRVYGIKRVGTHQP
jgi:hypothetical protein